MLIVFRIDPERKTAAVSCFDFFYSYFIFVFPLLSRKNVYTSTSSLLICINIEYTFVNECIQDSKYPCIGENTTYGRDH